MTSPGRGAARMFSVVGRGPSDTSAICLVPVHRAGWRVARTSLVTVLRSATKNRAHPNRWNQVSVVQPAGFRRR